MLIDGAVLAHPAHVAEVLHRDWVARRPAVIELAVDNGALRAPETSSLAPYALPRRFAFQRERLHFLVWANNYDRRDGAPVWWHGVVAQRAGAAPSEVADARLADGTDVWIDGGPRGPVALDGGDDRPLVHRESVALGRLAPLGTAPPRDTLAPDQLAAVAHGSGPARIIAPAGSGKTRVLTSRLRHLLGDRRYEPQLVTALAYNTRAAGEMRARTIVDGTRPNIRTFHSLGLEICNLDRRREVVLERGVRDVLAELVTVARVPNQDPYQPYLEALSEVRLGLREPAAVESERDDVPGFTTAFDAYRSELDRRDLLDFDEQIYRAIELLLTRPELRRTVQQRCTHLLVDEFQDLTPAFLLLARLVSAPAWQVFGVGDDDQVIYGYAGASPRYLIDFERWFPGAAEIALEVNYRCPPGVVTCAANLLGHNRTRVAKSIRAGRSGAPAAPPAVLPVDAGQMAQRTVEVLRGWLDGGAPPASLAVLTRVNSALLPVQVALAESGIAHTAPLDTTVLRRTGIRAALAYLRIGLDPDHIRREDLLDTVNRPSRRLSGALRPLLRRGGTWSLDRLESSAALLDEAAGDRLVGYVDDLRALADTLAADAPTAEALTLIRDEIGLGEAMDVLDSSHSRPEGSSHGDDLDALEQLAVLHPDPATFQDWLDDRLRQPGDPAGVTLSTIHRVKGMEWDRVVVFAANAGLFPHRLADDVEEERRVFHVAVTRCRDHVTVVGNRIAMSPFVDELRRPAPPGPTDPLTEVARLAATAPSRPTRTRDGILAEVGLEVTVSGGLAGRIVELVDRGATARTSDGILLDLAYGEPVTAGDAHAPLIPAPAGPSGPRTPGAGATRSAGAAHPGDEALFEQLRSWRARTASAQGVPAYVVLHDSHLREIAARRPRDPRALARCPGIGPTKLERYGDDILAIVTDAT